MYQNSEMIFASPIAFVLGFGDFALCRGFKIVRINSGLDKITQYFTNKMEYNITNIFTGVEYGTPGSLPALTDLIQMIDDNGCFNILTDV